MVITMVATGLFILLHTMAEVEVEELKYRPLQTGWLLLGVVEEDLETLGWEEPEEVRLVPLQVR
jgi:hypothetical protein